MLAADVAGAAAAAPNFNANHDDQQLACHKRSGILQLGLCKSCMPFWQILRMSRPSLQVVGSCHELFRVMNHE
jgi:hypothetical protein